MGDEDGADYSDEVHQSECTHEGKGAFCIHCGKEFKKDPFKGKRPCEESDHTNMRDKLKRTYCTICGKKL